MNIFDNIDAKDKAAMFNCLNAYTKNYSRGQTIFDAGADTRFIGLIEEGSVQMITEDMWGNTSLLSCSQEGDVFGESLVCAAEHNYLITYVAESDCKVLLMDYRRVLQSCNLCCVFHHRLIENMVKIIAEKNIELIKKIDVISKLHIREKIITYLSQCSAKYDSDTFTLPFGRVKMAEYLCVDRSALTRELSKMAEKGIIKYDKNTFTLL